MKVNCIPNHSVYQSNSNSKKYNPAFQAKLVISPELQTKMTQNPFYSDVLNQFKGWLLAQKPYGAEVVIKEKAGKYVKQLDYYSYRYCGVSPAVVEKQENLELSMNGKSSGFCFRDDDHENHPAERVLSDLMYVYQVLNQ